MARSAAKQRRNTELAEATRIGTCQCGGVRIETHGEPLWTATCHCADCRKATGAVSSAFSGYAADKAKVTGETFTEFESSPMVFRGFCNTCGSRLTYRSAKWPGELHFHVGAFDDPDRFAPIANVNVAEKVAWVHLEQDLLQFQTTSGDTEGS